MKLKRRRKLRKLDKDALQAILESLGEVEAHFEMEGFSSGSDLTVEAPADIQEKATPDTRDAEYDVEDEEPPAPTTYDRQDIEVAIDVCISELMTHGIISKARPGKNPTLSDIFENLFGKDHEIVNHARTFEQHIKGYFDIVGYEEMGRHTRNYSKYGI
jgi:hypothetical protein